MVHCVLSDGAIAGVVIGLIALFIAACVIPILVKWYCRKRAASPATNELQRRAFSEKPASASKWLKEQAIYGDHREFENEQCSICLSSLSMSLPEITTYPQPPYTPGSRSGWSNGTRNACRRDSGIIILQGCKHAFHLACLDACFEYQDYKCPLCRALCF